MRNFIIAFLFFGKYVLAQNPLCFHGTGSNSTYSLATTNDKGSEVQPLDVNNDGKLDIIYPSFNCLRYRLGNGNGTFGTVSYSISTGGSSYNYLDVVDINNDNNLDVIVFNNSSDFRRLINNGNGTFGSPSAVSSTISVNNHFYADFNNDSYTDIISVSGNAITCLKNNANNTFSVDYSSTVVTTNVSISVQSITSGDFDWDGNQDLAYHSDGSIVYFLQGNGACSFSATTTYSVPNLVGSKLTSFDFNNDIKSDLAVYNSGIGIPVKLYYGIGNNNFNLLSSFVPS